jgi:hypothetical protein
MRSFLMNEMAFLRGLQQSDFFSSRLTGTGEWRLCSARVKALCDRHQHNESRPSQVEIKEALHSTIRSYSSQVFIIIDALDECHSSAEGRYKLVWELLDLQEKTLVNLFTISRPIPEIESRFAEFRRKDVVASDTDVSMNGFRFS